MDNVIIKDDINIENMIYEIRGKQVMLDSDLAKLYRCANGTKTINLAVKRHINRFPERFMFRLTEEESKSIWFQIETKNNNVETRGGKYNRPNVFTEEGVAMLATILRTEVAERVSIRIMDAFVAMRHYIGNTEYRLSNVESKVIEHDNALKLLSKSFEKFEEKKIINEIYFKGQIYDAYSKIVDIFKEAKTELIVIDRYVDKSILDMIKELPVKVILLTKENNKLLKLDINKYKEQYDNLIVIYNDNFHDRYFILDRNRVYHCGTSIGNAGNRTFSINILTDNIVGNNLINNVLDTINSHKKMI